MLLSDFIRGVEKISALMSSPVVARGFIYLFFIHAYKDAQSCSIYVVIKKP